MVSSLEAPIVETFVSQDWASLTFAGERHHLIIRWPAGTAPVGDVDLGQVELPGIIVAVESTVWETTDSGLRLTLDLLAIAMERAKQPSPA